jgi:hypothetical protein
LRGKDIDEVVIGHRNYAGKLAAMFGCDGIVLPNIDPNTGKDFAILLNRGGTVVKPFMLP